MGIQINKYIHVYIYINIYIYTIYIQKNICVYIYIYIHLYIYIFTTRNLIFLSSTPAHVLSFKHQEKAEQFGRADVRSLASGTFLPSDVRFLACESFLRSDVVSERPVLGQMLFTKYIKKHVSGCSKERSSFGW